MPRTMVLMTNSGKSCLPGHGGRSSYLPTWLDLAVQEGVRNPAVQRRVRSLFLCKRCSLRRCHLALRRLCQLA